MKHLNGGNTESYTASTYISASEIRLIHKTTERSLEIPLKGSAMSRMLEWGSGESKKTNNVIDDPSEVNMSLFEKGVKEFHVNRLWN